LRPPRAYLNVAVNWTVDPSWVNCVSCRKNDQRGSMEFRRLGPKERVGVLGEGGAANPLPLVRWVGERLYISCLSGFCVGAPVAQRSVCSLRSPGSSDCYVIRLNSCRSPQSGSKLNCALGDGKLREQRVYQL